MTIILSDELRKKLIRILLRENIDCMFGDGLEQEYVLDGFEFKGLRNMTDAELIADYKSFIDEDDEPDEFLNEIEAFIAIEKAIA